MKIILDAFGGDYSPDEIIKASLLALYKHKELHLTLVGRHDIIQRELVGKKFDPERLEIINATEVIANEESPVEAIRTKKDSSIVKALEAFKADSSFCAFISAGSTGALLTGSVLKLGRIKGVARPALAPLLPTVKGGQVMIIDCGANMDSKPANLQQFALMGSVYMQQVFGIENPRVAFLSVGVEDEKGNELIKESMPLLRSLPINFVGNMEARDLLTGDYDVVVSDGFAGNVLLKATEGAFKTAFRELKAAIKGSTLAKIGALFMKKSLKKMMKKFDYQAVGGSVLLGTKGLVIKAHGSSKAKEFLAAIDQAIALSEKNINGLIEKGLDEIAAKEEVVETAAGEDKSQTATKVETAPESGTIEKEQESKSPTEEGNDR